MGDIYGRRGIFLEVFVWEVDMALHLFPSPPFPPLPPWWPPRGISGDVSGRKDVPGGVDLLHSQPERAYFPKRLHEAQKRDVDQPPGL